MYQFIYNDGSVSNHDTLEGMVEMLLYELLDVEDREREIISYKTGMWSDNQKIDFITMFDVQVVKVED